MTCYHGSPKKGLKQLNYTEDQSRFGGADGLLHGAAIYLTISENEAKAYAAGGSCYKLNINAPVFDATDENELVNFITKFASKNDLAIDLFLANYHIQALIKNTLSGKSSGVIFADHLFTIISNEFSLYNSVIVEKFNEDSDECLASLNGLFNYSFVKLNHVGSSEEFRTWVLCLDKDGKGIEILAETEVD